MRFLREIDYNKQITEKNLLEIISNDQVNRIEAENMALQQMRNYLSFKYDVVKIFAPLYDFSISLSYTEGQRINYTEEAYDNLVSYVVGDRVSYEDKIYKCVVDSTGNLPTDESFWEYVTSDNSIYTALQDGSGNYPEDTAFWSFGDTRDPVIVTYAIDIALYHLQRRLTPRNIPQIRIDSYDIAMNWLQGVKTGDSPIFDLPKIENEENDGIFVKIGSNAPRPQYY